MGQITIRDFIGSIPTEARSALDAFTISKIFKKGEIIVSSSDHANSIIYIEEGALREFTIHEEKELTTHFFFPHEIYFPFRTDIHTLSDHSLEALLDTKVNAISMSKFDEIKLSYQALRDLENFVVELSYKKSLDRLRSFQTLTARKRYLELIEKSPHLIQNIPLKYIASYLGINNASLSKIRAGL